MSSITINGREFQFRDTLADRIAVGLYEMKRQEKTKEIEKKVADYTAKIESELKLAVGEEREPKLPKAERHLLPFKLRAHLSNRKAWREILNLAIKKDWFWKITRIPPRKLWYSVISATTAEELKAGFFGLWEEILKKQNGQSKVSEDSKPSSTV